MRWRALWPNVVVAWFLALLAGPAVAHVSGYTDTSIQISASGVRLIYTMPRDNALELRGAGLGRTGDPGTPAQHLADVRDGWQVEANGQRCLLAQATARDLPAVTAFQYQLTYVCPAGMDQLRVGYTLLFGRWAEHENYARVFLAGQRMRMRYTAEQQELKVPVADLLAQWGKSLTSGYFDSDPNRELGPDGEPRAGGQPRVVEPAPSLGTLRWEQMDPGFIRLGVHHIFQGLDHVLFVVGLVLLTRRWQQLLVLVTCFTAAHSVTLALSTLGVLALPPAWVEPMVALTIVYVGVENLLALRPGAEAARDGGGRAFARRALLVFLFGLVHGVAFGDTLRQMGLREDLLGALLLFNVGVEIGQLAVIAAAMPLTLLLRRWRWGGKATAGLAAGVAASGAAMLLLRL